LPRERLQYGRGRAGDAEVRPLHLVEVIG
jgi:hypothetical protein